MADDGPSPTTTIPCFPDVLHKYQQSTKGTDDEEGSDVSVIFFELANASEVAYRLMSAGESRGITSRSSDGAKETDGGFEYKDQVIRVRQNSSVQEHTGGIVWETSYLLASFLLERHFGPNQRLCQRANRPSANTSAQPSPLGKVLEIGSGCGMLGLVLAASGLASSVILTECTEVMDDLRSNVERNIVAEDISLSPDIVSVKQLRWDRLEEDVALSRKNTQESAKSNSRSVCQLQPHSFDTIVGTDVVFTSALVRPLLACLALLAHPRTNIYLCLQVRCADSHALLLKKASKFGLRVEDCTEVAFRDECPSCSWGVDMECKLLHVTVKKTKKDSAILKRGAVKKLGAKTTKSKGTAKRKGESSRQGCRKNQQKKARRRT